MHIFNFMVGLIAVVFTVVSLLIGLLETMCFIHDPKHKNAKTFVLIGLWTAVNLLFVAIATCYCLLVATEHGPWLSALEVIGSFFVIALAMYKFGNYAELKVDGIDFNLVMGRKHT